MTKRKKERDTLLGGKGIGNISANEFWCFPLSLLVSFQRIHIRVYISRILMKILFLQALRISLS